jgi:hypothetical protein
MGESGYYLDLSEFSLQKLRERLKSIRLLPCQQILLENIDQRFACLEAHGIHNLGQLQNALRSKTNGRLLAEETALPVDYVTILRREVNSYQPEPIKLSDFPGVKPDIVQKLHQIGIQNTKQLFPHILTRKDRREFSKQHLINYEDILELTRLADIARLKWVGPKFAKLLIESEYDTVEKVAKSDYAELYHAITLVNEEKDIYKGMIGINDMKLWVNVYVQDVPLVIQYETYQPKEKE